MRQIFRLLKPAARTARFRLITNSNSHMIFYLILSKTKYIQPKLRAQTRGRAAGINGSRGSQGSQINPTLGPI